MSYDAMRHFADTWGLLFLLVFFAGVFAWIFRPGAGKKYEEQSEIPLQEDD